MNQSPLSWGDWFTKLIYYSSLFLLITTIEPSKNTTPKIDGTRAFLHPFLVLPVWAGASVLLGAWVWGACVTGAWVPGSTGVSAWVNVNSTVAEPPAVVTVTVWVFTDNSSSTLAAITSTSLL